MKEMYTAIHTLQIVDMGSLKHVASHRMSGASLVALSTMTTHGEVQIGEEVDRQERYI
jgi:hypothetical protein